MAPSSLRAYHQQQKNFQPPSGLDSAVDGVSNADSSFLMPKRSSKISFGYPRHSHGIELWSCSFCEGSAGKPKSIRSRGISHSSEVCTMNKHYI